jgi:hypothetical protein
MDIEVGEICTEETDGEEVLDCVPAPPPLHPVVIIATKNKSPMQNARFIRSPIKCFGRGFYTVGRSARTRILQGSFWQRCLFGLIAVTLVMHTLYF